MSAYQKTDVFHIWKNCWLILNYLKMGNWHSRIVLCLAGMDFLIFIAALCFGFLAKTKDNMLMFWLLLCSTGTALRFFFFCSAPIREQTGGGQGGRTPDDQRDTAIPCYGVCLPKQPLWVLRSKHLPLDGKY